MDHTYILYISQKELIRVKSKINDMLDQVEYFQGVIGCKDPTYKQYYDNYYKQQQTRQFLKPGEYGHIKSFLNILKDAKKNGYETITVFEPDIYFCKEYSSKVTQLHEKLDPNWSLLYLGSMQGFYYGKGTWQNIKIEDGYYRCFKSLGTFAVSIRNTVFDLIISELERFNAPTDVCLITVQEKYNCYVAYPNLVCSDVSCSGTNKLQPHKNQVEYMDRYRWRDQYIFTDTFIVPENTKRIILSINSKLVDSSITVKREGEIIKTINDPMGIVTIDIGPGTHYIVCDRCFLNSSEFVV